MASSDLSPESSETEEIRATSSNSPSSFSPCARRSSAVHDLRSWSSWALNESLCPASAAEAGPARAMVAISAPLTAAPVTRRDLPFMPIPFVPARIAVLTRITAPSGR